MKFKLEFNLTNFVNQASQQLDKLYNLLPTQLPTPHLNSYKKLQLKHIDAVP